MNVTATLKNFAAVSEFWHFNDTCGECAFLVLEHCDDGTVLNGTDVDAVRNDMEARGYGVVGGTTMEELVHYFGSPHLGRDRLEVVEVCPWGSSESQIHSALQAHAGRRGLVLQVADAQKLTGNERGVHSHFVAIGGIHPTKGYLVANGDDIQALNAAGGHGKVINTRWMSWAVLQSAQVRALTAVWGLAYESDEINPFVGNALQTALLNGEEIVNLDQPGIRSDIGELGDPAEIGGSQGTHEVVAAPTPAPQPASSQLLSELGGIATALNGVAATLDTISRNLRELLK